MSAISYEAKRNVDASRSVGTSYSFNIGLARFTRMIDRNSDTVKALSGARFTTLFNLSTQYDVATVPINDPDLLAQMREFLDSVAGGELFSIDPYGSVLSPDNPINLVLDGDYTETMVDLSGFYSFSFKVVVQ